MSEDMAYGMTGPAGTRTYSTAAGKSQRKPVMIAPDRLPWEVAGLRTEGLPKKASRAQIGTMGPALAELYIDGHFVMSWQRLDSHAKPDIRTFRVIDRDFSYSNMSHQGLHAVIWAKIQEVAD